LPDVAEDYYALLGLEPGADDEEIRKAWKRLALEHHPDRGGRDDRFLQISIAYDILSDPKLKAEYDRHLPPRPVEPIGKRAPGVLIHRLSGTLTTLLSSGAARYAETGVIELFVNDDEVRDGGMATISMRVPVRTDDGGYGEEPYTVWLAIRPGVAEGTLLTPTAKLPNMLQPLTFRIRR
jgi:curved DNA-binding protein CbpA